MLLLIFLLLASACNSLQAGLPIQEVFSTLEARAYSGSSIQPPVETPSPMAPELPLSLPEMSPTAGFVNHVTATPPVLQTKGATITPSPAPTISSDLVYLSQNKLMRWDHVTQYATLLVDHVTDFTVLMDPFSAYQQPINADMALRKYPRLIALLRSREVAANGVELYDLEIFDLEKKLMYNLLEKISKINAMEFTLHGDRLVYIDHSVDDRIVVIKTASGNEPQVIATCHREGEISCKKALWSLDGRSLVWSDAQGIWLSDDRASIPRMIQSNRIKVLDPKKQESQVIVSYEIISWSPDNRFILVKIIPSAQGVQWYSVLDTRMGRLVDIPGTAEFSTPASKIAWTYTGDILLAHSGNPEKKEEPSLQLWQIVPTNNSVLVPGKRLNLAQNASPGLQDFFAQEIACPMWLQQMGPNTFRLGVVTPGGQSQAFLTQLDFEKNILEQQITIPGDTDRILWAPDGSGALILGKRGQAIYASLINQNLYDLLEILGRDAHSFKWLSPAPR